MKPVVAVLLSLVLVACGNAAAPTDQLVSADRQTVVRVYNDNGYASAVIVAPKRVVTAAHVADIPDILINGKPVKVLAKDEDSDVAILEAEVDCPCAPIAKEVKVDDEVYIIGYPLQHMIDKVQIKVAGLFQGWLREGKFALFSGFAMPGSSGGGIFNKHGELVGVTSGIPIFPFQGMIPQMVFTMVVSPSLDAIKAIVKGHLG